jgi:hypothetical protein
VLPGIVEELVSSHPDGVSENCVNRREAVLCIGCQMMRNGLLWLLDAWADVLSMEIAFGADRYGVVPVVVHHSGLVEGARAAELCRFTTGCGGGRALCELMFCPERAWIG